MDRLHAMELFVRVVEAGSFSAAAAAARIGQPAVSKTIANLEAELGVRLLVRTTRGLHPTEAGQIYYERVRQLVRDADEARQLARGLGQGLDGRLRVCAPVTFARLHIAPRIGAFLDAHPRMSLDLVMDDRAIDPVSENIDVALRLGDLADSSLVARRLATARRRVVATPAYLARHARPLVPLDLMAHQAVVYAQMVGGERWAFTRGAETVEVPVPHRLACSAAEGVREAVLAGIGLAIVSDWMMAPELASGAVVPLLEDWALPGIDLWALYPAGRLPTARARAFVGWLEGLALA